MKLVTEQFLDDQQEFNRRMMSAVLDSIRREPRKRVRLLGGLHWPSELSSEQVHTLNQKMHKISQRLPSSASDPDEIAGEVFLRLLKPELRHVLADPDQLIRLASRVAALVRHEHYRKWLLHAC